MKKIFVPLFIFLALNLGCKKNPTFASSNDLDPTSEGFVLSPPSELVINSDDSSVNLLWEGSDSQTLSGYLVYRSYDSEDNYEEIAELSPSKTGFTDVPKDNPINVFYKVESFYNLGEERLFSVPIKSVFEQEIISIYAILSSELNVELYIEHNFLPYSEFIIQQRIGSDGVFETIQTLTSISSYVELKYDILPQEEVTYRVFAKNETSTSSYLEIVPVAEFGAPYNLLATQINESEVEISWTDYNNQFADEFILFQEDISKQTFKEVDRVSKENPSFIIRNLEFGVIYNFFIRVQKGAFVGIEQSFFQITNSLSVEHQTDKRIHINGLESLQGAVSSDGNYVTFSLGNNRQYLYDGSNLDQLYIHDPDSFSVNTDIFEFGGMTFFSEFSYRNNTGYVDLKNVTNNTTSLSIPPAFEDGGTVNAIDFIDNSSFAIVYSSKFLLNEWTHIVGVYDITSNSYINVLQTVKGNKNFKLSNSRKSILLYETFENKLFRYSNTDFSFLDELSLDTYSNQEITYFLASSSPDSVSSDSDYYDFFIRSDEIFRLNLTNQYKHTLLSSSSVYHYDVSKNGDLRCVSENTTSNTGKITCFKFDLFYFSDSINSIAIELPVRITGFILSQNDDYIIIVTENKRIYKYLIKSSWNLFNDPEP